MALKKHPTHSLTLLAMLCKRQGYTTKLLVPKICYYDCYIYREVCPCNHKGFLAENANFNKKGNQNKSSLQLKMSCYIYSYKNTLLLDKLCAVNLIFLNSSKQEGNKENRSVLTR